MTRMQIQAAHRLQRAEVALWFRDHGNGEER